MSFGTGLAEDGCDEADQEAERKKDGCPDVESDVDTSQDAGSTQNDGKRTHQLIPLCGVQDN